MINRIIGIWKVKKLNKDKISSDKYYQRSQAEYNVAMAELKGLRLELEMAGVEVDVEQLKLIPDNAMVVVKGGYYLKTEKAKQEE